MDSIQDYNREAWDRAVDDKNPWTVPVSPETIERARQGNWEIVLTPEIPIPREWFGEIKGREILGLASGGGQQGPILAAAGARVTVFDNSPKQLEQDKFVAEREGLDIRCVQGDMADLGAFEDASFDLIYNPCSNGYVPDVVAVWKEAFRVLKPGGSLLSGFANSAQFLFDQALMERGILKVRHKVPYSELTDIRPSEQKYFTDRSEPLMFGHSLAQQIGGQLEAGFLLANFFEDHDDTALAEFLPAYIATRAVKP